MLCAYCVLKVLLYLSKLHHQFETEHEMTRQSNVQVFRIQGFETVYIVKPNDWHFTLLKCKLHEQNRHHYRFCPFSKLRVSS